jgi:hypothetical protein
MIRLFSQYGIPILATVLLIYALIDAIRVPDDSMYQAGNKLIWVIVIVFLPLFGPIIYLAIGAPRTPRTPRRYQPPPDDII